MTNSENSITIPYTDDILDSTGLTPSELLMLAKLAIASKLFSDGKLSLGKAASLCELGKVEFIEKLHQHGYSSVNLRIEDAEDELRFAHGL